MRTIILLKQDRACVWEVLLKALHVAPVRAAPGINGLIWIANTKDILVMRCKMSHQRILREVRILEFIHQYTSKSTALLAISLF